MHGLHRIALKTIISLILLALASATAPAADVVVPRFSIISRGTVQEGSFVLDSRADVDVALEGGYKFGGNLTFSFESDRLEEDATLPESYDAAAVSERLSRTLLFESAGVTIRELFGAPMNMTYFSGRMGRFGTAQDFVDRFGTTDFNTHFQGYTTFPDSVAYEGLYQIEGTGISVGSSPLAETFVLTAYTYQDPRLGPGFYSSDLRFQANSDFLKLDFFAGASYPQGSYGIYRAGLLSFIQTSSEGAVRGQFFTQLGSPQLDPTSIGELSLEDFYFLFEPRLKFQSFSLLLTLFWHPDSYLQVDTGEGGALDANIRAIFGNEKTSQFRGGLDTRMTYNPNANQQLGLRVLPFLQVAASGILWDIGIRARVYPFSLQESFDGTIGITTEF